MLIRETWDGTPIPMRRWLPDAIWFWIRFENPIRRACERLQHWRAGRICSRIGHDYDGGSYWSEWGTAYWWQCRRCGDGDSSI